MADKSITCGDAFDGNRKGVDDQGRLRGVNSDFRKFFVLLVFLKKRFSGGIKINRPVWKKAGFFLPIPEFLSCTQLNDFDLNLNLNESRSCASSGSGKKV